MNIKHLILPIPPHPLAPHPLPNPNLPLIPNLPLTLDATDLEHAGFLSICQI